VAVDDAVAGGGRWARLMADNTKPDFSGEWVLDRAASTLSPGADGIASAVAQIEHRDPMFRWKAVFTPSEGKPLEYEFELPTDGREITGTDGGRPSISRLGWEGDALIASWRMPGSDPPFSLTFRYEIVEGGRRLRAAEYLRGTDHDQDNVWIFDRAAVFLASATR